jgi:sugar (pentulose or hexulose) kinase
MGWLGVDVGTSSTKAVVYADTGRPVGTGRAATPWYTGPHGVEVDPVALRESAYAAVEEAVAAAPDEVVGGVGVTSMGETGILVDGHGEPVAPAIAWHDVRDAAEAEALARDIDPAAFTRRTGKPPTNQYALTKHRWLIAHVPASRSAVRRFNVAEWVARGLGADEVSERSLASRTGWIDLAREAFDAELLAWSGAAPSLMPPLVEAGRPVGTATHPLLAGAVVTIAGHDHQAAAVGAGVAGAGEVLDSHGSAEAVLRLVPTGLAADQIEELAAAGITTDLGVRAGCWSLLGGTRSGLVLRHTLDALGFTWAALADLDAAALADPPHGHGAEWRAVIESETRDAAERMATMARIVGHHRRLVATGGWCASAAVLAAKRRLFGPLTVNDAETGTLGAATLAARAAGFLGPDDALAAP